MKAFSCYLRSMLVHISLDRFRTALNSSSTRVTNASDSGRSASNTTPSSAVRCRKGSARNDPGLSPRDRLSGSVALISRIPSWAEMWCCNYFFQQQKLYTFPGHFLALNLKIKPFFRLELPSGWTNYSFIRYDWPVLEGPVMILHVQWRANAQ